MAGESVIVMLGGAPFAGWKSVDITQSFDKASGDCTLVISEQPGVPMPAKLGDEAVVLLVGQPVITGYVHKISAKHDFGAHDITLTIRDKTQDFIDSTVGPGVEFKPPVKLKRVLEGTLGKMGLSDISVIDRVSPDEYRVGGEVPVAAIDDTGFGWADKWTRKRQVVLNTDGKGNLAIDRNQKRRGPGALIKMFEDSPLNNVLSAQYESGDFSRHNETNVAAQKSTNDVDHWESRPKSDAPAQANPLANKRGTAIDAGVRAARKLHIRARRGIEGKTPEDAAKWRSNLAHARNYTYSAKVQGFEMSPGTLWWPGYIIPVRDAHFEISDEMFIKEVKFHKDFDGGSITDISLTTKDAFSETEGGTGGGRSSKAGLGT